MKHVTFEVRVEPKQSMPNVRGMVIEEWVWQNGGQESGGHLRFSFLERRPIPFIFMAMVAMVESIVVRYDEEHSF